MIYHRDPVSNIAIYLTRRGYSWPITVGLPCSSEITLSVQFPDFFFLSLLLSRLYNIKSLLGFWLFVWRVQVVTKVTAVIHAVLRVILDSLFPSVGA